MALAAKLYCAATTIGTSDVVIFNKFAGAIHHNGILDTYKSTHFFNHTPLVGWFSEAAYDLAGGEPVRGEPYLFPFYLRLPAIFADFFATIAVIWLREKTGRPAWWALMLFAASPVAFMVSGYHGNVDSVMALGVLLAAAACAMDRPGLCGICLGLACNIKIIPLLLAPVFFFVWWERRRVLPFSLPAIFALLAGWSYPLFTIPQTFLPNVLGYGSIWGVWGITYALRLSNRPSFSKIAFQHFTPDQAHIMAGLKGLIIALALFLAWAGRRAQGVAVFRTLALVWAVFFVFAPGFGAQYLAWLAPCFLIADEYWYALITATSSIALFAFYTVISGGLPWSGGFTVYEIASRWTGWFVLPWLVLAAYLIWEMRRAWRAHQAAAESSVPADPISPANA
jgi:hypothetical protein